MNKELLKEMNNKEMLTPYDMRVAIATSIYEALVLNIFVRNIKEKGFEDFTIDAAHECHQIALSVFIFRKIVKKWERLGLIKTTLRGMPCRKYYEIHEKKFCIYINDVVCVGTSLLKANET